MIVKWLDFSDLHFEYTNVDTVNIRDNTPYIKGTIEEILDPVALFSSDTEGAVKYYVSGEEN